MRVTGLVCLLAAAAQAAWGGQAISPSTHLNLNIHKLTVVTARGTPNPAGVHYYIHGSAVSAAIASPVLVSGALWYCYGWSLTGGVPATAVGAQASFTIRQDATLTWRWTLTELKNAVGDWLAYE